MYAAAAKVPTRERLLSKWLAAAFHKTNLMLEAEDVRQPSTALGPAECAHFRSSLEWKHAEVLR